MNSSVWKFLKHSSYSKVLPGRKDAHQNKLVSFMMSLIRFGLTKDAIRLCPLRSYNGKVFVINSECDQHKQETQAAINILSNSPVVGFDTESRVDFGRTGSNQLPTALVQLAHEDIVILWRLRKEGKYLYKQFPEQLKDILTSNKVLKVGTGNDNDKINLYKEYDVVMRNTVDTQSIAVNLGFTKLGLEALTAQLFNWRISKARSKRLSNWEAWELKFQQISYAATDAWASLMVYKQLHCLEKTLYCYDELLEKISTFGKQLFAEKDLDHKLFKLIDNKVFKKAMRYDTFGKYKERKHTKMNYSLECIDAEYLDRIINSSPGRNHESTLAGDLTGTKEFCNGYILYFNRRTYPVTKGSTSAFVFLPSSIYSM